MTGEQYLLSALGALSSALGYGIKYLLDMLKSREATIEVLRKALENEIGDGARAEGRLEGFENCPLQKCPFISRPARFRNGEAIGEEPHVPLLGTPPAESPRRSGSTRRIPFIRPSPDNPKPPPHNK